MASDANGGVSRVQYSRAATPYASWLGYVHEASWMEICQDTGDAVQAYETARLYWRRAVHKELRNPQRVGAGSQLAAEVYV